MSSDTPYPSYPGDSDTGHPAAGRSAFEQPPSIKTAVTLMRAGAVVAVLGVLYSLLTLSSLKDQLKTELASTEPGYTASQLDTVFAVSVTVAVVLGLLGAGIWLWMAWANGRGRKWARIVATVLAALNALSLLFLVANGRATTISLLLSVVNFLIGITALFYLYRPDSNQFYAASTRRS